ncbi:MAG: hypothetical protein ACLU4N_09785 [Butyricimonas faecihominis]
MDHFVISGTIPGAMDSTEIILAPNGNIITNATGYVINGKFELKGRPLNPYIIVEHEQSDIIDQEGLRNKI